MPDADKLMAVNGPFRKSFSDRP